MDAEILANSRAFRNGIAQKFSENAKSVLKGSAQKIDEAYARMTTLQAWRAYVLQDSMSDGPLGFYSEAQNDGLTSIVLALGGLWRPSLKSIRSLLENVLRALYYQDHPVEYRLWELGKGRLPTKALLDYFETHPSIASLDKRLNPLSDLRRHYGTLSEAVHASAKASRMTDGISQTHLWKTATSDIGRWSTLHSNMVKDVNLLLLGLQHQSVQGARAKGLRQSLSISIPTSKDASIVKLGVKILR